MIPDDDVWIVNASGIPGHAGSLAEALGEAGYPVRELSTSAGDLPTQQTVIYVDPGADAAATVNELLAVLPGATHEDLPADGIAIIDGAEAARADLVVVLGSDQAHEPWLEPTSPLHQAPTGVLAVVDAAVTPDGHDEVAAQADTLREDGVDVAGVYPAATSISEELLMPIETSNRWTFAVAELVGIDGFDTWTPSFVDEPLPADVTAVVVLLGGDSVPEPTVAGSAVELPPQSAPGERPTLTTDCPDDSAATYIVERGDSLASIADELDVDLGDLLAANDLTPDSPLLAAGDCLVVP